MVLFLGVPLLLASIFLYRRGSTSGQLLLTGTLGYFLYVYASMALGAAYNRLFVVYVVLFSASLFAFVRLFASVDLEALAAQIPGGLPRLGLAIFMIVAGLVTLVVWGGPLVGALIEGGPPERYGLSAVGGSALQHGRNGRAGCGFRDPGDRGGLAAGVCAAGRGEGGVRVQCHFRLCWGVSGELKYPIRNSAGQFAPALFESVTVLEGDYPNAHGIGSYQCSIEGEHVMFYSHIWIVPTADEKDVAAGQRRRTQPQVVWIRILRKRDDYFFSVKMHRSGREL